MYVNLENLFKLEYVHNITFLLILKHAAKKDVGDYLIKAGCTIGNLEDLKKQGYVKFIKGTKNQSEFSKARLDKKGTSFLNSLQDPEIEQGDIEMFNYLCEMYLNHEDEERHVGNKKKTLLYCAEFRQKLDLSLHQMYWLCQLFLKNFEHTKKLEYIFFNSNKNRYGTFRNNMEDSPLYQFYDTRKKEVENYWREKKLI